MSAAVASVTWYAEDSASPCTVAKPGAAAAGDLLVAVFIQHNNPSAQSDLTQPSGWSTPGILDGVLVDGKVFAHVVAGGDPATWDFPYKSTADVALGLWHITGADITPTLVVSTTPTTTVTSPMDSPSVTPSGADDLLICCISDICNGTQLVVTIPSGMTDRGLGEVTGHFMSTYGASQQLASAAATGVRTWTSVSPTGITGGTWTIAIKSAASGASGSASITGTGALTATAMQGATAAPAGTGSLTAAVTQRAGASPAGAGALGSAVVQLANPNIAGAGSLAAPVVQRATASPAGAGALQALATERATAVLTGAGALTAAGSVTGSTVNGTANLAGASTLTAPIRLGAFVTAAGAGQLAAAGTSTVNGIAVLVGAGSVVATTGECDGLVPRPNTGTVTRPHTGTVVRPNTGIVVRPRSCP